MSTLSHRLLPGYDQEEITKDDFDTDSDPESNLSSERRKTQKKKKDLDLSDDDRRPGRRHRRLSHDSWDDDDDNGSFIRRRKDRERNHDRDRDRDRRPRSDSRGRRSARGSFSSLDRLSDDDSLFKSRKKGRDDGSLRSFRTGSSLSSLRRSPSPLPSQRNKRLDNLDDDFDRRFRGTRPRETSPRRRKEDDFNPRRGAETRDLEERLDALRGPRQPSARLPPNRNNLNTIDEDEERRPEFNRLRTFGEREPRRDPFLNRSRLNLRG